MTTAELLRRVRWGNVAKLLLPLAAVALIALWPRMRAPVPALPEAGARQVAATTRAVSRAPVAAPRRARAPRHDGRRLRRAHAPRPQRAPRRRVRKGVARAVVAPVVAPAPPEAVAPAPVSDPAAEEFGAP